MRVSTSILTLSPDVCEPCNRDRDVCPASDSNVNVSSSVGKTNKGIFLNGINPFRLFFGT